MPRYIIYARKSTESEDRQVLSIDSQIKELSDHARERGLTVAQVFAESQSASAPGRPGFADMLREISRRRADGILCWKLDRLARNPVDGGALIWAIEEEKIKEIATLSRAFKNDGNDKFWMQLEFGMAKKYVDDLSDNIKRGIRAKLERGGLPGVPPLGYLNDQASKSVIRDPDRFVLIRRMWDLLLAGQSPPAILESANRSWGLRTRRFRRRGDRPLHPSLLYRIFKNPFYYGLIVRRGNGYIGNHEPMVSKDEFDTAQRLLGRTERGKRRTNDWAYTGLIRCGECGASVTAEQQINKYGRRYVYYHCSKRKRGVACSQRTLRVEQLEEQFIGMLSGIRVSDDFCAWAFRWVDTQLEHTRESQTATLQSLKNAHAHCEQRLTRLTDLRLSGLIEDQEFSERRRILLGEKLHFEQQLAHNSSVATRRFELSARAFFLANQATKHFMEAINAEKRQILMAIGSNFSLKDRILRTELQKPFSLLRDGGQNGIAKSNWELIGTFFAEHPSAIQWPTFCKDPKVLQGLKRDLFRRVGRKVQAGSTRRARRTSH